MSQLIYHLGRLHIQCGEYSFTESILVISSEPHKLLDDNARTYYASGSELQDGMYYFHAGDVGVKVKDVRPISEDDAKMLTRLGFYVIFDREHDVTQRQLQHKANSETLLKSWLYWPCTDGKTRKLEANCRSRSWPNVGGFEVLYEGRWRVVHMQVKRLYIVCDKRKITVEIEGV